MPAVREFFVAGLERFDSLLLLSVNLPGCLDRQHRPISPAVHSHRLPTSSRGLAFSMTGKQRQIRSSVIPEAVRQFSVWACLSTTLPYELMLGRGMVCGQMKLVAHFELGVSYPLDEIPIKPSDDASYRKGKKQ